MDIQKKTSIPFGVVCARCIAQTLLAAAIVGATAWSAVLVKQRTVRTPLVQASQPVVVAEPAPVVAEPVADQDSGDAFSGVIPVYGDDTVRWFDGRRVRPVRTIWMKVTAYSPDARSCGKWADGKTATMHSVWTNAMRLVAADTSVLPYGSMITVPGYADSEIVPVLDCGGAIKGNRLDVLFPTHEIALQWGVRELPVTVWAYDEPAQGN